MASTQAASTFQTGHVGLNVSNLALSKRFYQEVFGFQAMGESFEKGREFVFLGGGGKLVLTLWQQSGERFDRRRAGLHHLSFQVEGIEQVRAAEQKLKSLSVVFVHQGIVPHGEGSASGGIFFEDPDGTRLEIYSPTGAHEHKAPTPGAPSCGFF